MRTLSKKSTGTSLIPSIKDNTRTSFKISTYTYYIGLLKRRTSAFLYVSKDGNNTIIVDNVVI